MLNIIPAFQLIQCFQVDFFPFPQVYSRKTALYSDSYHMIQYEKWMDHYHGYGWIFVVADRTICSTKPLRSYLLPDFVKWYINKLIYYIIIIIVDVSKIWWSINSKNISIVEL